jgi:hypothetical protein
MSKAIYTPITRPISTIFLNKISLLAVNLSRNRCRKMLQKAVDNARLLTVSDLSVSDLRKRFEGSGNEWEGLPEQAEKVPYLANNLGEHGYIAQLRY